MKRKITSSYAEELGIPTILLHVEKTNRSALRLYARLGFSICEDDEHRYLLEKILPSKA